ncbi:hypothetical protein BBP40_005027 [Aspergillus hancockii]|nr:hypothetical protein BBP40_005027 [Aspergillus hancockii]
MPHKLITWKSGLGLLFFFFLAPSVNAHSWVEQLTVIAPNGTFVGSPGYPRGYVSRSAPDFQDSKMMYRLPQPRISPSDNLCKETQRKQVQSDGSPRLQASAGAAISLRYQENGHVTLPQNTLGKPPNRGTVYVYGTADPKEDEKFLDVHNVWNKEGTGGDKRGILLSIQNYDDGRCYQVNDGEISKTRQAQFPHAREDPMGADLWCQNDIRLPSNTPPGKPYALYWVWDWPTEPGPTAPQGLSEIYTSCMDVDMLASSGTQLQVAANYTQDQSLNRAAIPSQFEEIFGSGASPGSAPSSSIAGASKVPTSPRLIQLPTPISSMAAPSMTPSGRGSLPTKFPTASQGIATVTSFVTMMKTIIPSGCSASADRS